MICASILPDRTIVAVDGSQSREFLQGLVTSDMNACRDGHAVYAALLTPQGKILFDFFVMPAAEQLLLLDCAASRAADLIRRLTLYRLRAKIEILPRPGLIVAAFWNQAPLKPNAGGSESLVFADPRLASLGLRIIGERDVVEHAVGQAAPGDYQDHRLALGIPDSSDLPPDEVFPLDAGLAELNGVSFKKGCYVGQEVTARMKHRGTARRRFMTAAIAGADLPPGTAIEAHDRQLGIVTSCRQGRALALVRMDRLADARSGNIPVVAAGQTIALQKPEWSDG